jgi:hypothetical protein
MSVYDREEQSQTPAIGRRGPHVPAIAATNESLSCPGREIWPKG